MDRKRNYERRCLDLLRSKVIVTHEHVVRPENEFFLFLFFVVYSMMLPDWHAAFSATHHFRTLKIFYFLNKIVSYRGIHPSKTSVFELAVTFTHKIEQKSQKYIYVHLVVSKNKLTLLTTLFTTFLFI